MCWHAYCIAKPDPRYPRTLKKLNRWTRSHIAFTDGFRLRQLLKIFFFFKLHILWNPQKVAKLNEACLKQMQNSSSWCILPALKSHVSSFLISQIALQILYMHICNVISTVNNETRSTCKNNSFILNKNNLVDFWKKWNSLI